MRMPSFSRSFEDWADYLIDNEMSVDDAIEKTSSEAVASWLDESRSSIEVVMEAKGTAVATFMSTGEIFDPESEEDLFGFEDDIVEDISGDTVEPAKGIRI